MTVTVSVVVELEVVVVVGSAPEAAALPTPVPSPEAPADAVTVCTFVEVLVTKIVVVSTELPEVKVKVDVATEPFVAGSAGKPAEGAGTEGAPVLSGKGGMAALPLPAPRAPEEAGSVPRGADGAASLAPVLRAIDEGAESEPDAPARTLLAAGSEVGCSAIGFDCVALK